MVDDVLQRKKADPQCRGIAAIVVYPMNALCNSQLEELEKYLHRGYGPDQTPVTFARYTGQESNEEREQIAQSPPDILLTNYVMLELIMTRFQETDVAVRKHAAGLRFLVLDELHTYRGRQGADIALLVRRVRERCNENLLYYSHYDAWFNYLMYVDYTPYNELWYHYYRSITYDSEEVNYDGDGYRTFEMQVSYEHRKCHEDWWICLPPWQAYSVSSNCYVGWHLAPEDECHVDND